jgi:hypothetical protein
MPQPVLSRRSVNRATLARQLLLERSGLDTLAAVEHLLGLQAQTPHSWYVGLWSRLVDFDPLVVGRALESHRLVRIAVMRSTIHLVSARDAVMMRPVVQAVTDRARHAFGSRWQGLDLDTVAEASRELLERRPLSFAELGSELHKTWPDHDVQALGQVARMKLALVQTPPRGVWGKSGLARHTTIESWLPELADAERIPRGTEAVDEMVLRYFGAFGPASVHDLQAWCGLTRLREVVERLRARLSAFRDEDGAELFDLPDAARPHADTPAPVRFLYDYDNVLLSYANRSRMTGYDTAVLGSAKNGILPNLVLVDGTVSAAWALSRTEDSATIDVRLLGPVSAAHRQQLSEEGVALARFLAPDSSAVDVRMVDSTPSVLRAGAE